jgi:hypothetical protein
MPAGVRPDRFDAGFDHGLRGGHLETRECFRYSFRIGFRTAKLYLKDVRRMRGVIEFPVPGRIRLKTAWR